MSQLTKDDLNNAAVFCNVDRIILHCALDVIAGGHKCYGSTTETYRDVLNDVTEDFLATCGAGRVTVVGKAGRDLIESSEVSVLIHNVGVEDGRVGSYMYFWSHVKVVHSKLAMPFVIWSNRREGAEYEFETVLDDAYNRFAGLWKKYRCG